MIALRPGSVVSIIAGEPPLTERRPIIRIGSEQPRAVARLAEPDAALDLALDAARAGDEAGFLTLWRTLQPRLLRYLRVRVGFAVGDRTTAAEDIAGETWLQVVRDIRQFEGDSEDFRRWLFTVAKNRSIDAARAAAVRPQIDDAEPDVSAATSPSAETVAMEAISTREALSMVATLPPEQAEVVALRVIAGLDAATVGEMTGKTPGAVRVSVHRGLRSLALRARTGGELDG